MGFGWDVDWAFGQAADPASVQAADLAFAPAFALDSDSGFGFENFEWASAVESVRLPERRGTNSLPAQLTSKPV